MKLSSLILSRYAADNYYLELKAVKKHHVGIKLLILVKLLVFYSHKLIFFATFVADSIIVTFFGEISPVPLQTLKVRLKSAPCLSRRW